MPQRARSPFPPIDLTEAEAIAALPLRSLRRQPDGSREPLEIIHQPPVVIDFGGLAPAEVHARILELERG